MFLMLATLSKIEHKLTQDFNTNVVLNQALAWFLKIVSMQTSMCVYVCVSAP